MRKRSLHSVKVLTLAELQHEPPTHLAFTDEEAPGALRNGTRVRKTVFEAGDTHAIGDCARIVGSVLTDRGYGYFVHWDDMPDRPVFVKASKIAPLG